MRKNWFKTSLLAIIFSLVLITSGFAQPNGQGNPNDNGNGGQGNHYGWGDGGNNGGGNDNGNNGNREGNGNNNGNLTQGQAQGQIQGQAQAQAQAQAQGQIQGQSQSSVNTNVNTNVNSNKASIERGAVTNTNLNLNNIEKGAVQNKVNNNQVIAPSQSIVVEGSQRSAQAAPEINPFYLVPLQNGKYGDYTKALPRFKNPALVKLAENDVVVKVLDVYYGNIFSRITFEEYEAYLLKKAEKYDGTNDNIRYTVHFQESVITAGTGGGAGMSGNSDSGNTAYSGGLLPSIAKTTANPYFIITFYEVEPYVVAKPKVVEKIVEKVVIKEVVKEVKSPLINLGPTAFKHNKAELTADAKAILNGNAEVLKNNPNMKISVEGYTSMSGGKRYNQKLSEKRAEAVKAYLVENGVAADRISTVGYGKTRSINEPNPNKIESNVAKENRKVVFVVK